MFLINLMDIIFMRLKYILEKCKHFYHKENMLKNK